jgi:hypothetical protein
MTDDPGEHNYCPPAGYVPDAETAMNIAEAVWLFMSSHTPFAPSGEARKAERVRSRPMVLVGARERLSNGQSQRPILCVGRVDDIGHGAALHVFANRAKDIVSVLR